MANVQPDKYTTIANELMEVVPLYNFNGTQLRIILAVWRYTYGFKRKEHEISISFLRKATGISKRQIQKEVIRLIDLNVLKEIQKPSFNTTRIIGFNKDYDSWKIERSIPKEQQENKKTEVNNSSTQQVNDSTPQQMNNSSPKKESIKENNKEIYIIFDFWNEQEIIKHRQLRDKMKSHINARLTESGIDDVKRVIENYATVLKGDEYFWTYKWGLSELMKPDNYDKFTDEADPLNNFKKKQYKEQQHNPYEQEIDPETEELERQIAELHRG